MLLTPQPLYSSNLIAQYCAAFHSAATEGVMHLKTDWKGMSLYK